MDSEFTVQVQQMVRDHFAETTANMDPGHPSSCDSGGPLGRYNAIPRPRGALVSGSVHIHRDTPQKDISCSFEKVHPVVQGLALSTSERGIPVFLGRVYPSLDPELKYVSLWAWFGSAV